MTERTRKKPARTKALVLALFISSFMAEIIWPQAAISEGPHPVLTAPAVKAAMPLNPHSLRIHAVRQEAKRAGISPQMALAVSFTENWGGDSLAVSHAGAVGIMQVMPGLWGRAYLDECGDAPLTNLQRNACVGVRVLAYYRTRYGSWDKALRAYNGSLHYQVSGDKYVAKVMSRFKDIQRGSFEAEGSSSS